jgi:UDP-N-acetylmuramyl tripeptide synthase
MKTSLITSAIALAALIVAGALSSCATTVTEITDANGNKTKTTVTTVDPTAATAALDRAQREGNGEIHAEK